MASCMSLTGVVAGIKSEHSADGGELGLELGVEIEPG